MSRTIHEPNASIPEFCMTDLFSGSEPLASRPDSTSSSPITLPFMTVCVLAIVIWGANWPVMKIGVQYIPPFWFAASRFASAAVLSFAWVTLSGKLRLPTAREWPVVVGVGVLQMGLFTTLVTLALHFVMPGRASLIAYATSIWVVPGAALVIRERMTAAQKFACACSYAGILIVVLPAVHNADAHSMIGIGLLLCASLSWALNILQIKMTRNVSLNIELLPWQTLVAAVPLTALAIFVEGPPSFLANPHAWSVIAYTGPVATTLTFLIVLQMTQRLSSVTISVCMLGVPVVGILLSTFIFHETLSKDLLLGLLLMGVGVVSPALPSMRLPQAMMRR
jgi:O-acetylserine/cysteine efflux transporter